MVRPGRNAICDGLIILWATLAILLVATLVHILKLRQALLVFYRQAHLGVP